MNDEAIQAIFNSEAQARQLIEEHARLSALVKLAKEMRVAQRRYFFSKDRTDLVEAKKLEHKFDVAAR